MEKQPEGIELATLRAIVETGDPCMPSDEEIIVACKSLMLRKMVKPQPMLIRAKGKPATMRVAYMATAEGRKAVFEAAR